MRVEQIKFVVFEDHLPQFKKYSEIIQSIFEKKNINAIQILPNHEDIIDIMRKYWNFKGRELNSVKERVLLKNTIDNLNLLSENIIYFIDDNWTNGNDNDGTDFFRDFLLDNRKKNNSNAIILTSYTIITKYDQMHYVHKTGDSIEEMKDIRNKITNTKIYRSYIKPMKVTSKAKGKDIDKIIPEIRPHGKS